MFNFKKYFDKQIMESSQVFMLQRQYTYLYERIDKQEEQIEELQKEVEFLKRIIDYSTRYNIEQNKKY